MPSQAPPFEITPEILTDIAEIAELVGKISSAHALSSSPTLRRANRIRTIHGSLAIERRHDARLGGGGRLLSFQTGGCGEPAG